MRLTDTDGVIVCTSDAIRHGSVPLMPGRLYYVNDLGRFLLYTGDQHDTPGRDLPWLGWRGVIPATHKRSDEVEQPSSVVRGVDGVPERWRQSSYRGLPAGVPTGRTYGANAGKSLPRLASKVRRLPRSTRVWVGLALLVFALMFLALFVRSVWLNVTPPAYVPQPTPTASPATQGFYFGMGSDR